MMSGWRRLVAGGIGTTLTLLLTVTPAASLAGSVSNSHGSNTVAQVVWSESRRRHDRHSAASAASPATSRTRDDRHPVGRRQPRDHVCRRHTGHRGDVARRLWSRHGDDRAEPWKRGRDRCPDHHDGHLRRLHEHLHPGLRGDGRDRAARPRGDHRGRRPNPGSTTTSSAASTTPMETRAAHRARQPGRRCSAACPTTTTPD